MMLKIQSMIISTAILLVLSLSADIRASKHPSQLWSFTFENISMKDALLNIRKQAGVNFSIDEDIVEGELSSRAISQFYVDKPLERIITDIFRYDNCAMIWSYKNERLNHVRIWIFQTAQETGRTFRHGASSSMMRSPARIVPGNGSSTANFKAPVRSKAASIGKRKRRPMRSKAGYYQPSAVSPSNAPVVSDSPATDRSAEVSYPSSSTSYSSSSSSYVSKSTSNNSGSSPYVSNSNSNNSGSSSYVSNANSNNSGSSSYVSNANSNTSGSSSYVSNSNSNTSGSSSYVSNSNSNTSGSSSYVSNSSSNTSGSSSYVSNANSNTSGSSSYVSNANSNISGSSTSATSASDSSGTDETTTGSAAPDAQTYGAVALPNTETSSNFLTEDNPSGNSEELVSSDEQQVITETENLENETEPEIALLDDIQIEMCLSKYLYGLE
ncbi:hypothetical protein QUF90_13260 [Desulfococcaceae bacterium HSG9]|nr:hypothetical protein [Desulfococcaceae bacterium HSG9]